MNSKQINILTIDCEDFFSLPAFKNIDIQYDWDKLINKQIDLLLKTLLSANDTKATFFIVGEIAKRNPELVKKIAINGHHIGSHSNEHKELFKLSKTKFETDLTRSINSINKAVPNHINCFRAPIWSYKKEMSWFWEVLKMNNITYDSSVFPISSYLFGNPTANRFIHQNQHKIYEIPPSTIRIFGINLPISGGIYFRFLPYILTKHLLKRVSSKNNHPLIMYFHPWEFDSDLIRVKNITPLYKFVLYYKTKKSLRKFNKLINDFKFTSIEQYFRLNHMNGGV